MKGNVENRAVILGEYIVENGATVRDSAQVFGVSKSTVHKDVTGRLSRLNPSLYRRVRVVLEKNKEERHIRGGIATRDKYRREREARAATIHPSNTADPKERGG